MKLIIPEINNPTIKTALSQFPNLEVITAPGPNTAAEQVAMGKADTMVSGLDYSSRDILLAFKKHIPLKSRYFSSCFICQREGQIIAVADGGVNKQPDAEKLYTIVEDTAKTFVKYTRQQPRIAMLSYSTYGSGGENADLEKITYVINQIRVNHPNYLIDGELQLDAAVNPAVAMKKAPQSPLKGTANILITPDLNSGNILYKSLEQFGGFTVAGPMIQGFQMPLADLSRGSSAQDVALTIDVLIKLCAKEGDIA